MNEQVRAPRRSDARDNRARILAAARSALVSESLQPSVREIARRAEVGPATVYRHFASKQALLAEASETELTLCSHVVEQGLSAADSWAGFSLVVSTLVDLHAAEPWRARAKASRADRDSTQIMPIPAADLRVERQRSLELMQRLTRRAQAAGVLRPDFVLEDLALLLRASENLRASTAASTAVASRRFTGLLLASLRAAPSHVPLPPPIGRIAAG